MLTDDSTIFQELIILAITSDTNNSNNILDSCMKISNLMMQQLISSQQALKPNIFTFSSTSSRRQVLHDRIRFVLQR